MRDMLIDVLRDLNSLTPTDRTLPSLMRQCVDANEMEAFSALLSLMPEKPAMEPANVDSLLKACIPVDAAECALLLLNHLEEIRCRREDQWLKSQQPWNAVPADVMDKINGSAEGRREVRDQFIRDRERFCQEFPKSRRLLTLARKAMNHSPEPAVRCARAFLLQAHRLRRYARRSSSVAAKPSRSLSRPATPTSTSFRRETRARLSWPAPQPTT